jgi:hypothetical protein
METTKAVVGKLPNGQPETGPVLPVQREDESNSTYAVRLAEAKRIQLHSEGTTYASQRADVKYRYELELANLDALEAQKAKRVAASRGVPYVAKPVVAPVATPVVAPVA